MKILIKSLISLLFASVMLFSLSVIAFASGNMLVSVDTAGESGSQIEVTGTSASIPVKIYAGENGGEFDKFDPSVLTFKFRCPNRQGTFQSYEEVSATCELISSSDGYCYVRVSSDSLDPGVSYYLFLKKGTYKSGDYSWTLSTSFDGYAFCTEGEGSKLIQWGDGDDGANPTVQVIYYTDGKLEIASCSENAVTPDGNASQSSIFTKKTSVYNKAILTADIRGGVKTIGDYYFSPCGSLATVTQSDQDDSLISIGNYAFKGCVSLRDFDLNSNADDITIADTAFDGCSNVTIHVKCDQLEKYQTKFASLANVTFVAPDHTWDDGVVTTEPTVDAEGVKTYTCSVCGETKTEPIDKLAPAEEPAEQPAEQSAEQPAAEVEAPKMLEGAGQKVEAGKPATFRADIPFADFLKVLADGKEVDKANYDAKEGSTIVTLHADFVKSLGAGKHTIAIVAKDGQAAEATFTVAEEEVIANTDAPVQVQAQVPATLIMFVLTALGVGIIEIKCRKNGNVIYN